MIRFVESGAEGLPRKRGQSQRACEHCRRRKKRCLHQLPAQQERQEAISALQASPPYSRTAADEIVTNTNRGSPLRLMQHQEHTVVTTQQPPLQPPTPRTAETVSALTVDTGSADNHEDGEQDPIPRFIGELNPEGVFVAATSPVAGTTSAVPIPPQDHLGIWIPKSSLDGVTALTGPITALVLPLINNECVRALPDATEYESIYQYYVTKIHPIFPIINLEAYQRQQENPKILLKLAICLLVSSNSEAIARIRQTPRTFSVQITHLLRCAVDNRLVHDKQTIVQILAILALSTQLSDDRHASAEFASRAVCLVQTGGLHLDTSTHTHRDPYLTRLFCCVFALDRLSAAVQGRPVLMHERDVGRNIDVCVKQQDSLFQLLLRVILLLDSVIAIYRPSAASSNDRLLNRGALSAAFPTFEDLLSASGTIRSPAAMVATVETLYHAVSMLSCHSRSLSELSGDSASHMRQKLSAASVISITGSEFRGQLSLLPFVPYAMSLALRVSYQDLRLSKSSFTRSRARSQLLHICTLLREQGDVFSSSLRIADLAEQTVREMDKAYSNMAGQTRASHAPAIQESKQGEGQQARATLQSRYRDRTEESTIPGMGPDVTASVLETSPPPDGQKFAPLQFDVDFDIFQHFDPGFDIEAIDAALANSTDVPMPLSMIDWTAFES